MCNAAPSFLNFTMLTHNIVLKIRPIAAMKRREILRWTSLVEELDPTMMSYDGQIKDEIQLDKTKDYQFQLLAYEGDITTDADEDYIETLPAVGGKHHCKTSELVNSLILV